MPYASRYTGFTTALSTIELFITWLRHFFIGCAALWHMSIIIISQLHIYFWFREIPSFFYNGCTSPQHSVKDVLIFCTGRYYVDVPNAKFYTLIDSTFFSPDYRCVRFIKIVFTFFSVISAQRSIICSLICPFRSLVIQTFFSLIHARAFSHTFFFL